MTIVVFEAIAATAFCSCVTVETLTTAPVDRGSGTGGNAGPAAAAVEIDSIRCDRSTRTPAFGAIER